MKRKGERRELDAYYTPPELAEHVWNATVRHWERGWKVLEPSVGSGAFLEVPLAAGARVTAIDVNPDAPGLSVPGVRPIVCDFLEFETDERFNVIIGNPPYSAAAEHVRKAISLLTPGGIAVFVLRLSFLASRSRLDLYDLVDISLRPIVPRPSFTGGGTDASEYGVFTFIADDGWDDPRMHGLGAPLVWK